MDGGTNRQVLSVVLWTFLFLDYFVRCVRKIEVCVVCDVDLYIVHFIYKFFREIAAYNSFFSFFSCNA